MSHIPRTAPTWGIFIDQGGGRIDLRSARGDTWPTGPGTMVRFLGPGGSNTNEGLHRAPRPWKFDQKTKATIVAGDYVEIRFFDDDVRKPYVRPGGQPLDPSDADFLPANPIGQDPNPIRGRWVALDDAGNITGHLQVTALDGGNGFELLVGGGRFGEGTRIELDHTAGTIKLGQGTETHQVAFGEEVVADMKKQATAIMSLNAIVAAKLISSPPDPVILADMTEIIAKCEASLSAGAPYLSTTVKVQ